MTELDERPLPKSHDRKIQSIRRRTPFRFDPMPSTLCEYWLPYLNLRELRAVIYITRRTWGFGKEWDAITIEQFCSGVKTRDGKTIDLGTGLGRTRVKDALCSLESKGLIEVQHRKTRANLYRITIRPVVSQGDHQLQIASHTG